MGLLYKMYIVVIPLFTGRTGWGVMFQKLLFTSRDKYIQKKWNRKSTEKLHMSIVKFLSGN